MPTLVNDKPTANLNVSVADIARNISKNVPGLAQASGRILAQEKLNECGADVGRMSQNLRDLALESGDDAIRHKATVDVLKIHGALDGDKLGGDLSVTFNFNGGSVNLQQILCPDRMTTQDVTTV